MEHIINCEIQDGLGFCLSSKADLLSQWRGYANDGKGMSIGFNSDYLTQLTTNAANHLLQRIIISRVDYEPTSHIKRAEKIFHKIDSIYSRIADSYSTEELHNLPRKPSEDQVAHIAAYSIVLEELFLIKPEAFDEEQEWRIISTSEYEGCEYIPQESVIKPFIEIKLDPIKGYSPIKKVYIGPKNETPINAIKAFMRYNGFEGVEVIRSKASYR